MPDETTSPETPLGVEPSNNEGASASAEGAGTPVDISDSTLVRIPGQDEPVTYGELHKRLQADYTRKTQQHAKQVAEWDRQRAEREQGFNSRESELKQLTATLLAQQQKQGQGGGQSYLDQLATRPYLDGKTAASLLKEIQTNGFGSVAKALEQRDATINTMGEQINQLSQMVKGLQGSSATSAFDGKVNQWLNEGGYPPEAADWMKEMYLGYEQTPDLDEHFPALAKERWDQLARLQKAQTQRAVEAGRKTIFPMSGGQGAASNPLGLKGNETAKQTTDMLWEALQADGSQRT